MKKYLLATDGSKYSQKAAQFLIDMIRGIPDVKVSLIYVNYVVPVYHDVFISFSMERIAEVMEESAEQVLAPARAMFEEAGIPVEVKIKDGFPALEICKEAKNGLYDLVVVGSHGYGAIDRAILGSVSERVAEECSCPVLVVK